MIALRSVSKSYPRPGGATQALRSVDLDVARGERMGVVGRSGSGKSTLLHLVAGLDAASSGALTIDGQDLGALGADALARWRGRTVGVVFQSFQLLPTLSAVENVMLPMDFLGALPARMRRARAEALLDRVGVADQADKRPATLSGGQQQRVAIARALANEPAVLLADEPTGNLDSVTGAEVFSLLAELARAGTTVLVATHDRDALAALDRVVTLRDGEVVA